jgi:hypothetical protein
VKFEWNQKGLQQLAEQAGRQVAAKAQDVYDRVLNMGTGKSTKEVRSSGPRVGV